MPGRRILLAGWTTYALFFASYAVMTPYLPLYLGARGFSVPRIGLLLGCFELAGIAGPIIVTLLADRLERYRRFIALTLLASVACFLLLHAARSFESALLLVIGLGFCFRSSIPLADALLGRILPDPTRQYGIVRVAGSAGFLVVSLVLQLTGWVSADRPQSILAAFAVLAVPAALAVAALPPVSRTVDTRRGTTVPNAPKAASNAAPLPPPAPAPAIAQPAARAGFDARFWTVIGVLFLARFGIAAHYSFFSLYLHDTFAVTNVSAVWAIGAAVEIPMILFSGRLITRFGIRATLTAAVAAITVRLALYGLFPTLGVVLLSQLLHAFTFGMLHTASVAFVNAKIDASRRGLGMAVYSALSLGLASFIASGAGGYLVEAAGYRVLFLAYAAVPVLGLVVLAVRDAGCWAPAGLSPRHPLG